MPSSLIRAALALLCAGAVIYATALFPAALDVELQQQAPVDGTEPAPTPAPDTPTATPTPTPTATQTPTPTPAPPDRGGGSGGLPDLSFLPTLVALLGLTAVGYVGVVLVRASDGYGGVDITLPWIGRVSLPFAGIIQRIPQVTTAVLLTGGAGLARVTAGVGTVVSGVGSGLAAGLVPFARMAGRSLTALPTALVAIAVVPVRSLAGLTGGGLFASFRGGFERPEFMEPDDPTTEDARTASSVPAGTDADDDPGPPSIREAWERLTDAVPVDNPTATTPGEYARRATDVGLPEGPVWRLTELFRAITYGGESPSAGRTEAARDALEDIFGGGDDS
ncbi:DUF4129 domain-containing protein [Halomicroarcula sp. S1AR25-4]|uniref:DUF4129 domain-containing protein n=1 Tax=Haloarcula sp. S1AR25-4 TaxID=2950538 RepID=UPI002875C5F8|nr:DUF4129 domain-containing protein [Halomicroarcula sp. S1AR25-4]MDS0277060.1 DUF4129 domain-containing protein [Halomicroarcula sp. S1AR25-4]